MSLLCYLRDLFIQVLPFKLPSLVRRFLYGSNVRFIFVVHPRRKEDVFIAAPFLRPLRRWLPGKLCYKLIEKLPPSVLCTVHTQYGVKGIVIYKLTLPDTMLLKRKKCLRESYNFLSFASKISERGSFVGLGGWWPIVTKRGLAIQRPARKVGLKLTNGHCGTLCSLYLMIEKIASVGGATMQDLKILVIGGGKMGTNLIKILKNRVAGITIIDRNENKLNRIMNDLRQETTRTIFNAAEATEESISMALENHHICICTTSNLRRIIKPGQLPKDTLVIDDSRPEAFPRIYSQQERIVILEGGLMKIPGANCNYDFGFGQDDNFFGCLTEAFILALDSTKQQILKETSGDVDEENFWAMLAFCRNHFISVGDFKSSNQNVSFEIIRRIIQNKTIKDTPLESVSKNDFYNSVWRNQFIDNA